ncbi:hypothetical protein Micbo1qcDRAFT_73249 [Microdochium bolleyi]|uniref:Uncharacterized protein n=1 Tax=Microdochium bolleyi TaxID=196109 RepID=A0A136IYL7_9PEZI|nr:hypothetical protein Micbo1qcDRAFT_73249 [Microdochium bolleyi]
MASRPSPAELAGRPTYTRAQLEAYFDLVSLPHSARRYTLSPGDAGASAASGPGTRSSPEEEDLAYLTLLMKHQLVRVPFENLTLHYSWHKVIDPSPVRMYKKIVGASAPVRGQKDDHDDHDGSEVGVGGGQGGYCMEVNSFFFTVLLSIGFDVYMAGARVWSPPKGKYLGLSHCVCIVTVGGDRYLVDVGNGPNVGVRPLKLEVSSASAGGDKGQGGGEGEGVGAPRDHIAPAKMRLKREPVAQGLSRARGWNLGWVYQVKYDGADDDDDDDDDSKWITQYMFLDSEFLPEDIAVCNMQPGTSRKSFFTYTLLCVRFTTEKEHADFPGRCRTAALQDSSSEIDGALILWGDVFKWRRGGRTVLERKIESDLDRLDILKKYFGIVLDEEDVLGIKDTAGALGGL